MSSASAIADGIVTLLSAASAFGQSVSKNSYQILESSGSAVIVQWSRINLLPNSLGGSEDARVWDFSLRCFIRESGDLPGNLEKTWLATDKVINCIESDPTLQGTVNDTRSISARHEIESSYNIGGATWTVLSFNIECVEY